MATRRWGRPSTSKAAHPTTSGPQQRPVPGFIHSRPKSWRDYSGLRDHGLDAWRGISLAGRTRCRCWAYNSGALRLDNRRFRTKLLVLEAFGGVAQLVRSTRTVDPVVAGSSPVALASRKAPHCVAGPRFLPHLPGEYRRFRQSSSARCRRKVSHCIVAIRAQHGALVVHCSAMI